VTEKKNNHRNSSVAISHGWRNKVQVVYANLS